MLVLDSINFRWSDKGGKNHMLYSVLAAYGYDELGKNGRLVKVDPGPSGGTEGWTEFLRSKPGRPIHIVADQDKAVIGGVIATWGPGADLDLIHHCEHHLRKNAADALDRDKLTPGDDIRHLFRDALISEAGWDAFEAAVIERPGLRFIRPWTERWGTKLRVQAARRADRPSVYANGAVESALAQVRTMMEPRMYSYKNRARTNRMLELVRLSMLRADDGATYTAAIRAKLVSHEGHLQRGYRAVYDKRGADPFESKYSLWSAATQKTMAETKRRHAAHEAMIAERLAEAVAIPID